MLRKTALCLGALALAAALFAYGLNLFPSHGKPLTLQLSRGPLTVFDFSSKKTEPSACILFASGDGGWGTLEEGVAQALRNHGCTVIGIDSKTYARTDYDLQTLQSDFGKIAAILRASVGDHPPPLIVGGYSMGAAQAIAVAGGPHPPAGLIGLLVMDPLSRGRYGLRSSDQMNILPIGPGTFSVDAFSKTMNSLRVVQWHAANDPIDSRSWLDFLTAPHESFTFPDVGHDYGRHRRDFLRRLVASVDWILKSPQSTSLASKSK
jgi:phosphatidylglycerol lysyltransferase